MENTKLATDQQRISNLVIDTIIIYLLYSVMINIFLMKGWIIYLMIFFAYYLIFESTLKQTVGKMITKTRVVKIDGSTPNLSTIFLRTIFRCIPFEFLSFIGSKNPTGWHDSISNTRVEKI